MTEDKLYLDPFVKRTQNSTPRRKWVTPDHLRYVKTYCMTDGRQCWDTLGQISRIIDGEYHWSVTVNKQHGTAANEAEAKRCVREALRKHAAKMKAQS